MGVKVQGKVEECKSMECVVGDVGGASCGRCRRNMRMRSGYIVSKEKNTTYQRTEVQGNA